MCSIAGYIQLNKQAHNSLSPEDRVLRALNRSVHRGPDHQGVVKFEHCAIGHNRLSINDLSEASNQPFFDSSGRYVIVLNGEIFNFHHLRKDLEQRGYVFRTTGDTEVVLNMLIEFGEKALDFLEGFFAFAFYDNVRESWLIARDRFGEKPLFIYQDGNVLAFASELRGLQAMGIPQDVDPVSLALLLQFSFIPPPNCILKNVEKLEPGKAFKILHSGNPAIVDEVRWYNPKNSPLEYNEHTSKNFKALLVDSVRRRLIADVPVGCFLSGGVDSSVIASIASKEMESLKTFSLGFADSKFIDETEYADRVAKHLGTSHHIIRIQHQLMEQDLSEMLNALDEPSGDSSAMAVWLLSREVKKEVTVALSGDGADELLAGYNRHRAMFWSSEDTFLNRVIRRTGNASTLFMGSRNRAWSNRWRQIRKYAIGTRMSYKMRYLYWSSFTDEDLVEKLVCNINHPDRGARINTYIQNMHPDDMNSVLIADQRLLLPGDMLPKVDTMSMAHALEVRPPFMDYHVVEFCNRLPVQAKISKKGTKILLKETFGGDLPQEVFERTKKGFEIPLETLLRGPLRALTFELLGEQAKSLSEYLDLETRTQIMNEFFTLRKSHHASLIYGMLVFAWWARKHKLI